MLAILKETWGEIAFLMGLSGGIWYLLEPPIHGSSGTLSGFVGVVVLGTALGVRATLRQWTCRYVTVLILGLGFVAISMAVVFFADYVVQRSHLVMNYRIGPTQTVEIIRGMEYQPGVDYELRTDQGLLSDAGGLNGRSLIWTRESIIESERRLSIGYVRTALATLLAAMFFVEILRLGAASR
ncbi:hypothetical protein [Marinobacter salarius]|jgi:hypothetical protein|uniref:hypothetical protein n=1 Tax=Marinobacter salarius TaxID=1420917 RepID=UPI00321256C2